MNNLLDLEDFRIKKANRINSKKITKFNSRKTKREAKRDLPAVTEHCEWRIFSRKLNDKLLNKCLKEGKKKVIKNSIHYNYQGLRVIVSRCESSIITAYNPVDLKKAV